MPSPTRFDEVCALPGIHLDVSGARRNHAVVSRDSLLVDLDVVPGHAANGDGAVHAHPPGHTPIVPFEPKPVRLSHCEDTKPSEAIREQAESDSCLTSRRVTVADRPDC